jgi:alanyl-tRNA synthetase
LRFDFSFERKLTESELATVTKIINEAIEKKLPVNFEIMSKADAEATGALHFFGDKYGDQVKVYYIGATLDTAISKEFCGGPHVDNLSKLQQIDLYKQETIGTGLQRIYARFFTH